MASRTEAIQMLPGHIACQYTILQYSLFIPILTKQVYEAPTLYKKH